MSLKPTKLIVCADLSDLQAKRREFVEKYEKTKRFIKWSDNAVELTDKLFIFKVVNIPSTVIDSISGYTEVEMNHLTQQIDNFVKDIAEITNSNSHQSANTSSEATGATEDSEKVEESVDTQEEQKNEK